MSRFAKQSLWAGFAALAAMAIMPEAMAQSTCQEVQTYLEERKVLVEQLNKASANKKQIDPKFACNIFTRLNKNGDTTLKWFNENKAWCQIPDDFIDGFTKDHNQVAKLRTQSCNVAAQIEQQRKQAQQGGGNPAWGGGLSGQYRMPQGAL